MNRVTLEALSDELQKIAKIVTPLNSHQQRVVDRIQRPDQPGLVVAHGLGSGKTLTAIAAQDAIGKPADVVVPAALRDNFAKELKKHKDGGPSTKIQSMQNVSRQGTPPEKPVLIVDEAHRMRDPSSKTYQTLKKTTAEKRLLLTATPFYNHPADIAPLVNVAAGETKLPTDRSEFERQYITTEKVNPGLLNRLRGVKPGVRPMLNPRRQRELQKTLQQWVDYHEGGKDNFPDVEREDVKVEMSPQQLAVYDSMMGKAPLWVRAKVRAGLPPTKTESKQLNAFLGAVRQISNTTGPYQKNGTPSDPKIQKAYENLKAHLDQNPEARAVVYSNFLAAGIDPYKQRLDSAGIPYGEFTGEMPKAKRDQLVRDYNEGKIRALLLSSAGGEGLDLKGTRLMQVLEPHWNDEKLNQVEGRGIRYKSHDHLPPEQRKVLVQRYLATRPRAGLLEKLKLKEPGFGVDEYLTRLSEDKDALNSQFRELLKAKKKGE